MAGTNGRFDVSLLWKLACQATFHFSLAPDMGRLREPLALGGALLAKSILPSTMIKGLRAPSSLRTLPS